MRLPRAPLALRALSAVPLFAAGAVLLAGCGGAGAEAKSGDTGPLSDQAGAMMELNQAEGQINALFGPSGGAAASSAPAASAAPYASPPGEAQPTQAPMSGPRGVNEEQLSGSPAGDACGVACRALASMTRAAEHFCDLAGESDVRCSVARDRVKTATERVAAHCTCER